MFNILKYFLLNILTCSVQHVKLQKTEKQKGDKSHGL